MDEELKLYIWVEGLRSGVIWFAGRLVSLAEELESKELQLLVENLIQKYNDDVDTFVKGFSE